ncbi:MAG TPA: ParB N-terminal domain-containing protein, partial [Terriglobia bacterium]|nr:ParB N-terminal domain-containing protein [Terriglobia bacterium]
MNIADIPIDQIAVSRLNTRKDLAAGNEDSSIDDLAESIREKGLLNPVMVRVMPEGGYELIAGQRRLLACRKIGLQSIPALIRS